MGEMSERDATEGRGGMSRRTRQSGMTTVEMALVGGLFFSLIFSILQFANWVLDRTVMMNAALEGARVFAASRHYATPYESTRRAVNARLPANLQVAAGSTRMKLTVTEGGVTTSPCYSDGACRTSLGTSTDTPPNVKTAVCMDPGTTASVNLAWNTPIFWTIRLPGSMTVTMSEMVQGVNTEPCP